MEPEIPINSYHSVLEEAFIANLGQDKQQFPHLFANPFLHQLPFANQKIFILQGQKPTQGSPWVFHHEST